MPEYPENFRDLSQDRALVERHLSGDADAFQEIVLAHESRVYAVAYRMCGNSEDARDVSQEVFVNAFRALPRFRVDAPLSVWFYRSTVNASINLLRKRRPVSSLEDAEIEFADQHRAPEELAVAATVGDAVRDAIEELPDEFRAAVILRDLEDLDYGEIAEILDVPIGTVRSRIHRGRSILAKRLAAYRDLAARGEDER
jgi:RNA polymerase sigma-70 factor, ECF subfamily